MNAPNADPGPWFYHTATHDDGRNNGSVLWEERPGMVRCVCKAPQYASTEKWAANAQLIAEAPELLKAVKYLRDYLCTPECPSQCGQPHCNGCQRDEYHRKRLSEIDALIAKAEGRE